MKDELAKTIKSIKEGEKEEFEKIIDKLNPIITKYVRAIYDGDKEDAKSALLSETSIIDKATSKGVYHKNTSSRKIGRMTVAVNKMN